MRIKGSLSVFGLGYVGAVTGSCLADRGFRVTGVDTNRKKVLLINKAQSPIVEKGLDQIISRTVRKRMFSATTSHRQAVLDSDISIICVGTPSKPDGSIDLSHLEKVSGQIGEVLRGIKRRHIIIVRSTVLPGTIEKTVIPIIERVSGKRSFRDFGVMVNPEFMREGNSVEDFYAPAKIIVGSENKKDLAVARSMYSFIDAPFIATDIKTAEFSKYIDNIFHALKISFANEIGFIAKTVGVDGGKAMDIFRMDKKSNISSRYLMPGFAFGGSCLPKDIKAVLHRIRIESLELPLLESVLKSNDLHIRRAFEEILKTGKKDIGILGLSFKPGTDDLRESQMVKLAELLIGKGMRLKIYDRNVLPAKITGTNKTYIQKEIPHISSLLTTSLEDLLDMSGVIVVGHDTREFKQALKKVKGKKIVIDLTV